MLPWSASPVHPVLKAVGLAMNGRRLNPGILKSIPMGEGAIIPRHSVEIVHISGKDLNQGKGKYFITIEGPQLSGRWIFFSGELERAARGAAQIGDL